MQHLDVAEIRRAGDHDVVEMLGAQRSAGHHEGRPPRVQAEPRGSLLAVGLRVMGPSLREVCDGRTQRKAHAPGLPVGGLQLGRGEGQAHRRCETGSVAVGEAGLRVLFVDDDGDSPLLGRLIDGGGDETAESDGDVGPRLVEDAPGLFDGAAVAARESQGRHIGAAREGHLVDEREFHIGLRDERRLQAFLGSHGAHSHVVILQGVRGGKERIDVAGATAAR